MDQDITLKLTKSEYKTIIHYIEGNFVDTMEHEVFKKEFSWKRAYALAGVKGFENSNNCSQANTIYKFIHINNESLFREFMDNAKMWAKAYIDNNTTIITQRLKNPQYKEDYDNINTTYSKLDSYIEWYKKTYPNDENDEGYTINGWDHVQWAEKQRGA